MPAPVFPSSAQWPQERSAAVEPVDVRPYLVAAGPPMEFGIEDGLRAPGGPAFIADGLGGYVIDSTADDALAMAMVRMGLNVWLVGADSVAPAPTNALLLEDGASFLLLEDGVSQLLLEG